jgi:hypothetical protein
VIKLITGAIIDTTEKYRYSLWRIWDDNLPRVTFVMLNPSTADASKDDPTIRRCINFAKDWGFGSLEVVNLFSYRATNPKELFITEEAVGAENDFYIVQAILRSEKIIVAWGTKGYYLDRNKQVLELLKLYKVYALSLSNEGHPKHPLYIKSNIELIAIN